MRKIHQISGIFITVFVAIHLFNHVFSLFGANAHIELMNDLRVVYRNSIVETLLLFAVAIQIFSGIKLFLNKRKYVSDFFDKLQVWSGLYLALFLVIHVGAVLVGRYVFDLDTNFYFGVAGLNTFPINLFFIPYYCFAIISIFGHIAAIHAKKMKNNLFGVKPNKQAMAILIIGFILSIVITYGLTNGFSGVEIPKEFDVLIGK